MDIDENIIRWSFEDWDVDILTELKGHQIVSSASQCKQ
jgi:hypothetical protein